MIKVEKRSKEVMWTFDKIMNTLECKKIEAEILNSLEDIESVVFNLNDVEYVASSFLDICGKSAQKVEKENFKVINANASVSKVFKIAGLSDTLNVC